MGRPPLIEATKAGDRATALSSPAAPTRTREDGRHDRPALWPRTRAMPSSSAAAGAKADPSAPTTTVDAHHGSGRDRQRAGSEAPAEGGADADATNPEGQTPLMAVARTGNVEAAKLLISAGADVDAKERWGGQSALMWAAAQGPGRHGEVCSGARRRRRCARRGARLAAARHRRTPPKGMNRGGFTPLLYAAREGCIECAAASPRRRRHRPH